MSDDRIRNRGNIIADIFMAQTRIRLLEAQMAKFKEELAELPKEEKKVLLLPPARQFARSMELLPMYDRKKIRKITAKKGIVCFDTSWGRVCFEHRAFKKKSGANGVGKSEHTDGNAGGCAKISAPAKPDFKSEMKEFAKFATEYYCKRKLPYCFDSCNGFIDFTGFGEPIMFRTKKDFDNGRATNLRFAWYCWLRGKQQINMRD